MHVFPGLNYYVSWEQQFWHQAFTETFLSIIDKHQEKISLVTGAHIHRAEFRDSISMNSKNLSIPFLISQSFSPVYLNNPGYTIVDFEEKISVIKQSF